jgi:hypothetical protein
MSDRRNENHFDGKRRKKNRTRKSAAGSDYVVLLFLVLCRY